MDVRVGVRLIAGLLVAISLMIATAAWAVPPLAGKLVFVQGTVTIRRGGVGEWVPAQVQQAIYQGDEVMTGAASRAAILSLDESQITLNENAILTLRSVVPSPRLRLADTIPSALERIPRSLYRLLRGEIWLRNNKEEFRFEMETPAVTATIRGTEFTARVRADGTTVIALLTGQLFLHNPQGDLLLSAGEESLTPPGQAPSKRRLVQPTAAVQWVLSYPGIISYRDLPLAGPGSGSLSAAYAAYDQGRLAEAAELAQQIPASHREAGLALTLLGWINLQRHQPQEALAFFSRVARPDWRGVAGLALARYRLGDVAGAYELVRQSRPAGLPTPSFGIVAGFLSLMVGQVAEAQRLLEGVAAQASPAGGVAGALLAQMALAQNHQETARQLASRAMVLAPDSPLAHLTMGLVHLTAFDRQTARRQFDRALTLDPNLLEAYLYLTRLWLGSEHLQQAWRTISTALRLAPQEAEVLSLAGMVRLAFRDYTGALPLLNRAVAANLRLGEPHIGLAIYHFRYRRNDLALTAMLTATLLEPQVAAYQSQLGRALYQVRAFDKSLEVYDYAKTLDPLDPTPYLYKGIALSDLNRPGEAVQEINRSIELNDHVAMFRSRSLLDRNLAVRNTSLARAYQQLGLTEWAWSKAVTAVNYQPFDSSAHLFLRDVILAARGGSEATFLTGGLLFATQVAEGSLYRILAPANQNTFSSLQLEGTEALGLTNDYTSMFEMPYLRLGAAAGVGAGEGSTFGQNYQGFGYGGTPGLAGEVFGKFIEDQRLNWPSEPNTTSFQGNQRLTDLEVGVKWEPTVQGTFWGAFEYLAGRSTVRNAGHLVDPSMGVLPQYGADRIQQRTQFYELAYYYRWRPETASLVYYAHRNYPVRFNSTMTVLLPGFAWNQYFSQTYDLESHNIQLQQHQQFTWLGRHNLIAGFDYYTVPRVSQRRQASDPFSATGFDYQSPQRNYSFYLVDYWRPLKNLVVEMRLVKDLFKGVRFGYQENIHRSWWSPSFGLSYQFAVGSSWHVLSGAAGRSLNTHLIAQALLLPSLVAGFPWVLDTQVGAEMRQAGAAWEAQWDRRTFTVLRLQALRIATPTYCPAVPGVPAPVCQTWRRYLASLIVNRILTDSLGLSAGVMGKRVLVDRSYEDNGLKSLSEINAFLGLAYLHRQGWLARLKPLLIQQYGNNPGRQADNPAIVVNLTLGREFPRKRGFALVEVQNLFNRRPFFALEPYRDLELANQRRFLVRVGLYF